MRASIQELARNVDRAQLELDRAKEALLAALSGTVVNRRNIAVGPRPAGRPLRGPGSDSVAARVLALVQSAGAAGIQRQALISQLGGESVVGAVTAALKQHSAKKHIVSDGDGTWRPVPEGSSPKQKAPRAKKAEGAK